MYKVKPDLQKSDHIKKHQIATEFTNRNKNQQ